MAKKKMILDLDTGIDDALAIAYALTVPEADLIGVIGSYGNVLTPRQSKTVSIYSICLAIPKFPSLRDPRILRPPQRLASCQLASASTA